MALVRSKIQKFSGGMPPPTIFWLHALPLQISWLRRCLEVILEISKCWRSKCFSGRGHNDVLKRLPKLNFGLLCHEYYPVLFTVWLWISDCTTYDVFILHEFCRHQTNFHLRRHHARFRRQCIIRCTEGQSAFLPELQPEFCQHVDSNNRYTVL